MAWQSLPLHDYDGRFTSFGHHNVVAEAFANSFYQLYDRNYAGFTNRHQTFGERISDDIVSDRNTFGFGCLALHQLYYCGVAAAISASLAGIVLQSRRANCESWRSLPACDAPSSPGCPLATGHERIPKTSMLP